MSRVLVVICLTFLAITITLIGNFSGSFSIEAGGGSPAATGQVSPSALLSECSSEGTELLSVETDGEFKAINIGRSLVVLLE